MKRVQFFICALSLLFIGLSSVAETGLSQGRKNKKATNKSSYVEPWGMAGCGLWTYVIKEKQQGPQLAVWALRHLVFDSQTSGISSGTSNCVHGSNTMAQQEQEVFISVNFANLSKEASQGEGEYLNALAEIFGCPHNEFAKLSQSRYGQIYGDQNPSVVHQNYKREVNGHQELAQNCARAS